MLFGQVGHEEALGLRERAELDEPGGVAAESHVEELALCGQHLGVHEVAQRRARRAFSSGEKFEVPMTVLLVA